MNVNKPKLHIIIGEENTEYGKMRAGKLPYNGSLKHHLLFKYEDWT